jgi:hypothetical protein
MTEMIKRRKRIRVNPEIIADFTIVCAASVAIGLGIVDILKLYDVEEFSTHIPLMSLFLLSFLIIAIVVERRYVESRRHTETLAAISMLEPHKFNVVAQYAGVRNLYTSRADYAKFRGSTELRAYLGGARRSIDIVAYWLSHGIELEGVSRALAEMITENQELIVCVAIISPSSPSLAGLASYLGMRDSDLVQRIQASLDELIATRQSLPKELSDRLVLKVYNTLPVASVIMLDVEEHDGRIQLDFKLYKTARQHSLGIEVVDSSSGLYKRVAYATKQLISEAETVES